MIVIINNNNNNNNDNNNNKNENIIYTLLTSEGLILFNAELRLSGFRANSLKAVNETSCGICTKNIKESYKRRKEKI